MPRPQWAWKMDGKPYAAVQIGPAPAAGLDAAAEIKHNTEGLFAFLYGLAWVMR
jgi:hypothetical protein